jgi:hypothetical protein
MDLIASPLGKTYNRSDAWGDTSDIIRAIQEADTLAPPYTRDFALSLHYDSVDDLCRQLWHFVRDNVQYQEDPNGYQNVQLPGPLYHSGAGDCKSMTLFTASVLANISIPYRYRFISQDRRVDYHHVYLVVTDERGRDIILDCVEDTYGAEVPHEKQKDMRVTPHKVSGIIGASTIVARQLQQLGGGTIQMSPLPGATDIAPKGSGTLIDSGTGTYVPPARAGIPTWAWLLGGAAALYFLIKD